MNQTSANPESTLPDCALKSRATSALMEGLHRLARYAVMIPAVFAQATGPAGGRRHGFELSWWPGMKTMQCSSCGYGGV